VNISPQWVVVQTTCESCGDSPKVFGPFTSEKAAEAFEPPFGGICASVHVLKLNFVLVPPTEPA
jgi:hypothetical protein